MANPRVTSNFKVPEFLRDGFVDLFNDLTQEANQRQSPRMGDFSRRAAAVHEASHCVVAVREGEILHSARVWQNGPNWFGETRQLGKTIVVSPFEAPHTWLSFIRCTLAGRRGELLFEPSFCLRAGLEELAYSSIMVMCVLPALNYDSKRDYPRVWGTTLIEVDETLLRYKSIVLDLADKLMRKEVLRSRQLADILSNITPRTESPPIREERDLVKLAVDPLA